ncbi:MAG: YkgJ family cysteine cluster protein [Actinomycetota bacterium]|nr:YkgJ family cysteine cluster protein [Actinomycetota bacterium]
MDDDTCDLPAGAFGAWLAEALAAIGGSGESDVPCGECTACCRSAQFIHIAPDERDALAHIPTALLFPAPGAPRGHMLMGYDEQGRCPMLVDDRCTIYAHRPHTCRVYDCRVFAAAGIDADGPAVAEQARRWRFEHPTELDDVLHAAVRSAAEFVRDRSGDLPREAVPATATQAAVAAVRTHRLFLRGGEPTPAEVAAAITHRPR